MESKMKHTPEPWHCSDCIISTEYQLGTDEYVAKAEAISDARRIVACVNACKHYTTEGLEDVGENLSGVFADVRARCAELVAQRDELLAAIDGYLPYMPKSTAKNGGACGHSEMLKASDRIRDAFAKCEVKL